MRKSQNYLIPDLAHLAEIISGRRAAARRGYQDGTRNMLKAARRNKAKAKADRKRELRRLGKFRSGRCVRGTDVRQKLALAGWRVLCARMDAGCWYGTPELRALIPEYAFKSVRVYVLRAEAAGLIERGLNGAWDVELSSGQAEPQYLYRLTARGEGAALVFRDRLKQSETKVD